MVLWGGAPAGPLEGARGRLQRQQGWGGVGGRSSGWGWRNSGGGEGRGGGRRGDSSYDFVYKEDNLNRLRVWLFSLTAIQGGAAGEDGNEGKAGGDGDGATEMEALRAFAESVGYKGDIMDGVVTECAGGAIE